MKRLILVLAACAAPPAKPVPVAHLPATPAGTQMQWVFDGLATPSKVDAAAIQSHFAPSFLAQVPAEQITGIFGEMSKLTTGLVLGEMSEKSPRELVVHITTAKDPLVFSITVDEHGQIAGLLARPEPLKSFDAAIAKLDANAAQTQLLAAELEHGACKPLHAHHETAELAIGSTLKLYVLLALSDRIAEGQLAWTQDLAVRDDWKSLPSGITQDDPAGTKLSIKTFAERMISISDNTATDHLLYTVGRERVEAAMGEAKHSAPARNVPYLSTRELFWLKLGMSAQEVTAYRALDPAARRSFLEGLAGKHPPIDHADDWTLPRDIDLEWFASSIDLCNAMAVLQTRGQDVLDVLGKNPGLSDKTGWKYVGFKGGSEPGVLSATWLLERDDGRWFVVTMGMNDPKKPIAEANVAIGQSVIALLAKER